MKGMNNMKYLVHYYVEGFGGQKEYFDTLQEAQDFIHYRITSYAEDITITRIKEGE